VWVGGGLASDAKGWTRRSLVVVISFDAARPLPTSSQRTNSLVYFPEHHAVNLAPDPDTTPSENTTYKRFVRRTAYLFRYRYAVDE
jgi:hypothetical protein